MKLKKIFGVSVVTVLLCLTGCMNKNAASEHEAVTILAPYIECDCLAELVHEKYPEVNLEILSYSGANTTQYLQNMDGNSRNPLLIWKNWQRKQRRQGYSCAWRRLNIRVMAFNICAILRIRDFWVLSRASSGKRII